MNITAELRNSTKLDCLCNDLGQVSSALILLYFNLGVVFYLVRMGSAIRRGMGFGKKYTRILIPSFVFILFADIFFTVVSVLKGGVFRGWLARKKPENQ